MSPCTKRRGYLAAGVAAALVIPLSCAWASKALDSNTPSCRTLYCISSPAQPHRNLIEEGQWHAMLLENAAHSGARRSLLEYEPPRSVRTAVQTRRRCTNAMSATRLAPLCASRARTWSRVGVTDSRTGEVLAVTHVAEADEAAAAQHGAAPRHPRVTPDVFGARVRPVHDDEADAELVEAVLGDGQSGRERSALVLESEEQMLIRQLRTPVHHL